MASGQWPSSKISWGQSSFDRKIWWSVHVILIPASDRGFGTSLGSFFLFVGMISVSSLLAGPDLLCCWSIPTVFVRNGALLRKRMVPLTSFKVPSQVGKCRQLVFGTPRLRPGVGKALPRGADIVNYKSDLPIKPLGRWSMVLQIGGQEHTILQRSHRCI